ncbi:DNA gyrase [Rhizobium sp. TRM95111]|uniref:Pnap_2097 family protein n=1 Tax=Rhizobium alarense TaxID=2846851 RepID=UPI001F3D8914|nr:Pnap_2097 family protein [Rhizobium alarense]MCF3640440.1 DNA gyrase [Rhizobium alarense]
MNATLIDFPARLPSAGELMERALEPHLLVGMPHLNAHGLSETWLMKELGHRHWLMLARHLGMGDADFRTPDGTAAYAAICATSLRQARLGTVRANDVLAIRSFLAPVSRSQVMSLHKIACGEQPVAEVELISTFVRRDRTDDNHSLVRVERTGNPLTGTACCALAETAAALRRGSVDRYLGMDLEAGAPSPRFRFTPSISEEFNGAGLFYFAEFQAMCTRALDAWHPDAAHSVSRRDVFFSGNLRPAEPVSVVLVAGDRQSEGIACRIDRTDGATIGRMFALR